MPSSPDALTSSARPRATALGAFVEGWRRVVRAPAITAGIFAVTILTAAPLALVMRGQMQASLGSSVISEPLTGSLNTAWTDEFSSRSQGLGRTFSVQTLGFGGTLAAVSQFVDQTPLDPALAGAVAAYLLVWIFLSGGMIDRFARARPVRMSSFFGACGVHFFRFLRLAVVIGAAYWALFRWLHPWLFHTLWDRWTRDMTDERTGLALRIGLYAIFLGALAGVNVIADFAKVRVVVEDRRSMISALGASVRFVRRRPIRVCGLYLLNVLATLAIARLWLQLAPTAFTPGLAALFIAQIYVVVRLVAKLAFMASEIVFFQGELAHAEYTAAPEPVWPDSPAVEAVRGLRNDRTS